MIPTRARCSTSVQRIHQRGRPETHRVRANLLHNNQKNAARRARQIRGPRPPPSPGDGAGRCSALYGGSLALDDFEPTAPQRLPKSLYGYIAGGAETEPRCATTASAFDEYDFVPRVLYDVSKRDQTTTLFGKTYASPFGIPPMGPPRSAPIAATSSARSGGDERADDSQRLVADHAGRCGARDPAAWYQAYLAGAEARIEPLVDRVAAAGFDTFVVTVDMPVPPNRENNVRNGFQTPIAMTPRVASDTVTHPRWLFGTWARTLLHHGMPHFENIDAKRGTADALQEPDAQHRRSRSARMAACRDDPQTLEGQTRRQGHHRAGGCAHRAREPASTASVSNHGGRQLDYTVSRLRMLPEIAAEAEAA